MTRVINPEWKENTISVHSGEGIDPETRALRRPIHMANSYELPTDIEELLHTIDWNNLEKYYYTRELNPTIRHLEQRVAALEGGEDCIVTASGMGALAATFFTLLNSGDHVVASEVCYTGTQKLLSHHLRRFGVDSVMVDTAVNEEVAAAIKPYTKMIFVETPGNPIAWISDIKRIAQMAHDVGAILVVDSTWASPMGQKALELGADIVIHSTTKYINGHGDALGGAVIGPKEILKEIREGGVVHLGACASPFNAWMMLRGSVTLPMRFDRHSQNALKVARFLEGHPKVLSVGYPWLESHPHHELAKRQMAAGSGMLTFNLKVDIESHFKFLSKLNLITHAVSLGHDQSLVWYIPTDFFFMDMVVMNDEQKEKYRGIMGEGIFRFSVGIEDAEDIIADLSQALDQM